MPREEVPPQDSWQELQPLIDHELSQLPERYRIPLILCDLEGKSRKDVAQELRLAEETLSSRLARARTMLAGRLGQYGLTVSGGALAAALWQQAASAALLFSFTSTCQRLSIVPWAYLQDVLSRLPALPPERRAELLLDRWQAARSQASATSAERPAGPTPASHSTP